MPTTLTLKNIPDALYGRLKEVADEIGVRFQLFP